MAKTVGTSAKPYEEVNLKHSSQDIRLKVDHQSVKTTTDDPMYLGASGTNYYAIDVDGNMYPLFHNGNVFGKPGNIFQTLYAVGIRGIIDDDNDPSDYAPLNLEGNKGVSLTITGALGGGSRNILNFTVSGGIMSIHPISYVASGIYVGHPNAKFEGMYALAYNNFTGCHPFSGGISPDVEVGDAVAITPVGGVELLSENNKLSGLGLYRGSWQNVHYVAAIGDTEAGSISGFPAWSGNGDVTPGTLLTASPISGVLMAQEDDIIRSHTIGKSLATAQWDAEGFSNVYGILLGG